MGQGVALFAPILHFLLIIACITPGALAFSNGSVIVLGVSSSSTLVSSRGTQIVLWEYAGDGSLLQTFPVDSEYKKISQSLCLMPRFRPSLQHLIHSPEIQQTKVF